MKRWLIPTLVLTVGLTLVAYLQFEQIRTRKESDRNLARLAGLAAEPVLLGLNQQLDLEWVRAFPQLQGLEVSNLEGKVLQTFGTPGQGQTLTVRSAGQAIGNLKISTVSTPWNPLPLFAVLAMAALTLIPTPKSAPMTVTTTSPTPTLMPENLTGSIRSALGDVGQTDAGKALARELSDQLRAGSVVLELNGDLTIRSVGGALEGLGYARAEMVGKPITSFLQGFRPDQTEEQQANCMTKTGAPLASHVSAVPVLSPSGELERVVVVMRDSTSGGRRVRERLGELEALHRSICDNANDLIVSVTADGTIAYANQRWRTLTSEAEPVGRTLLMTVSAKHRLGCQEYFYQALMQGRAGPFELQILGASGATTVEGSFHLTPKLEGRPQLVMGIFRDVTAQRETEERFRHAQKMEAVGRLAGGIAHDFNNLLTIIFSYTSMLEMEAEDHEELIEYVRELRQASERAAGLTRQLLLFSRSQTDEPVVLSVNTLTRDLARLAERLLGEKIDLQLLLEAKPDTVRGDQSQLEQVLMNLLVNARDSLNGEGRVRVHTCRRRVSGGPPQGLPPGDYVCIEVSDNGCGIPPEYLSRIFEPYFTTKIGGRGTGLGLSTVYAIVERYQGRIEIQSELGEGTTFTVLLPAAREGSVQAGQEPTEQPCCQGQGRTALLVEDEEAVRSAVGTMLARCGFRVLSARDGEEGEGMIKEHVGEIDLLVTDLVLPKRSGPEIASVYAQEKPEGRILYISGYPADVIREHGLPGHGAFLSKPFGVAELRSKLKALNG